MTDDAVPGPLRYAAAIAWRVLVIVGAIVVVAFVVAKLRIIVVPAFVALLLCTQLTPVVDGLARRGAPRWLAAIGSLLLGVAIVAVIAAAVVGTVVADFDRLEVDFEGGLDEVGDFLVDELDVPRDDVDRSIDDLLDNLRGNAGTLAGGVFTGASLALEMAAGGVLAVVMLFFFLKDGALMWQWLVDRAPAGRRGDARAIGRRVYRILGAYFRGTFAVALIDGVFIGLALLAIGVPLVLPLAVLTFFGGFVPIVGAVPSICPSLLVCSSVRGLW